MTSSLQAELGDLLEREDERREWKENVADEDDVIATLCAFANDLAGVGGGAVVCGVKQVADAHGGERAEIVGLPPEVLHKLEKSMVPQCHAKTEPPVPVRVERYRLEETDKWVLVFRVAASPYDHRFKPRKANAYYPVRIGQHTRRANGDLPRLLEKKGRLPPYLNQAAVGTDAEEYSLDRELLAQVHRQLEWPKELEFYLTPDQPLPKNIPSLLTRVSGAAKPLPRRVTLLLFSPEPRRHLAGAYLKLAVYPGTDKTADSPAVFELTGPLIEALDTLLRRLQPFLGYVADKRRSGPGPVNIPFYSERALREALANALVHRDYQSHEPTRVDVFADRIEIFSPGGLPPEVSVESFTAGEAAPRWRNPALAHWMERLGQVQYQGQGMATIIQEIRSLTGKSPGIRVDAHSVTLVLPASRPNASLVVAGGEGKQEGVLAISFGWQSIAATVGSGLSALGLESAKLCLDYATAQAGYVTPGTQAWNDEVARLKEEIHQALADPEVGRLHVFYRGPVSIAMMIGALIAPRRSFTVYNLDPDTGAYHPHLQLDSRFLRS